MSFALPRNVPNFENRQRHFEDNSWGSGKPNFPPSYGLNAHGNGAVGAVADKIGGMFGDKAQLPMYKDKPFYSSASPRRHLFRKKRAIALFVMLVVCFLYFMGILGREGDTIATTGTKLASSTGKKSSWGSSAKGKTAVDWEERRQAVKDAFKLSWSAYETYAWGYDEFHPVKKEGKQMADKGLGWIIVDALDTLMLMNLTTELNHAREWIATTLTYDQDQEVNTFETTIRMLGGLLSAHYLSTTFPDMAPITVAEGSAGEDLYLEKASDLADRLMGAYDSKSGVPYASVNLKTGDGKKSHADDGASSTAEATSVQLEMKYLSKLTGEKHYWNKAERVMQVVDENNPKDGLVPIFIYADKGTFRGKNIRLGSRGDSYYEYLIKQYLQTNEQEPIYESMWNEALLGIRKHLLTYSSPSNFTILAERPHGLGQDMEPKMDHLVCFMPGTIALAATGGKTLAEARKGVWTKQQELDYQLAVELMKTCWGMYKFTDTGLAAEITYFNIYDPPIMHYTSPMSLLLGPPPSPAELDPAQDADWLQDFVVKPADTHNLQRPETVESLFYMWRITGEEKYREWGWEMFQNFVKHTAVPDGSGFSSINDVTHVPTKMRDNMESFWLAETLKYFYLLFGPDDILPLDKVVFNTEAHPFPRFDLGKLFWTGWRRRPRDQQGNFLESTREEPAFGRTGRNRGGRDQAALKDEERVVVQTIQVNENH